MRLITIKTPKGIRRIGPGEPVFIVAEMSGNHNGSLARAKRIIDAAAKAGADAIKLQTYTEDTLTIDADTRYFRLPAKSTWAGKTLYELYGEASTPWEWHRALKRHAEQKGLVFFSTPFDESAVSFLEKLRVPLYKVAGYEIGDTRLLRAVGRTKKPVIISAAMTSKDEVALAVQTLRKAGARAVAVLHCVNAYPAAPDDMNIRTIPDIMRHFKVVSGLSDHSLGNTAAGASVALGGSIIEKHFTLSRRDGGPDAAFSLEPSEFKAMVRTVRDTEKVLGVVRYGAVKSEERNLMFKRSLFVVEDVRKGERFTPKNVRSIRPGFGMPPKHFGRVLGKKAARNIPRGTPLRQSLISRT